MFLRFLRETGLKGILNCVLTSNIPALHQIIQVNLLTGGYDLLIELIFLCFFEFEHKNQIDTPFAFKGRPSFHLKKSTHRLDFSRFERTDSRFCSDAASTALCTELTRSHCSELRFLKDT